MILNWVIFAFLVFLGVYRMAQAQKADARELREGRNWASGFFFGAALAHGLHLVGIMLSS